MKINFEDINPISCAQWNWIYGTLEDNDKQYPFSLLEIYDPLADKSEYELTWTDDDPDIFNALEIIIRQLEMLDGAQSALINNMNFADDISL